MSSISSSRRPSSRGYDTGFPDSFASRTTSLRHPEANTMPGASISAEDIDPARSLTRSRKSFMHNKHKRTLSYGRIIPEMAQQTTAKDSSPAWNSIDSAIDMHEGKSPMDESMRRPSKDTDSIGRTDGSSIQEDLSPITPTSSHFGSKAESPRKSGVFSRIRRHW